MDPVSRVLAALGLSRPEEPPLPLPAGVETLAAPSSGPALRAPRTTGCARCETVLRMDRVVRVELRAGSLCFDLSCPRCLCLVEARTGDGAASPALATRVLLEPTATMRALELVRVALAEDRLGTVLAHLGRSAPLLLRVPEVFSEARRAVGARVRLVHTVYAVRWPERLRALESFEMLGVRWLDYTRSSSFRVERAARTARGRNGRAGLFSPSRRDAEKLGSGSLLGMQAGGAALDVVGVEHGVLRVVPDGHASWNPYRTAVRSLVVPLDVVEDASMV